jgi:hypothetical protein
MLAYAQERPKPIRTRSIRSPTSTSNGTQPRFRKPKPPA